MSSGMLEPFLEALPVRQREALEGDPQLPRILDEGWERARAGHPAIEVPVEQFASFLAARVPPALTTAAALEDLPWVDLHLASACVRGDRAATELLSSQLLPDLDRVLGELDRSDRDEARQLVLQRVLVGSGGRPPRIGQYQGRGDLRNWTRVAALRQARDLVRQSQRRLQTSSDGDSLLEASASSDPEMLYLKDLYAKQLESAFHEALDALSAGERTMLRQHYLDGLSLEQVGALHRVHQTTASRRMAEVRRKLFLAVRERLGQRLALPPEEFESLLRLVRSQLKFSVRWSLRGS